VWSLTPNAGVHIVLRPVRAQRVSHPLLYPPAHRGIGQGNVRKKAAMIKVKDEWP
jgi:hypothetical protein